MTARQFMVTVSLVAALACALVAASVQVLLANRPVVLVRVVNSTGHELTGVRLLYSGGRMNPIGSREYPAKLSASESLVVRIVPTGKSGFAVQFSDVDRKAHQTKLDIYLAPHDSGTIEITVHPGGDVSFTTAIKHSAW
jgi:hypothetical protein